MIYVLASTHSRQEFNVAHAINAAGALAVVPRRVDINDGEPVYRPFLPNYIFLAMSEKQWHDIHTARLFWDKPQRNGQPVRTILPPFRKVLDILPRTWSDFQGFAERAEQACKRRLDQWETGLKVASYRQGDLIQIVGDLMSGQLHDPIAEFLRLDAQGRIIAKVRGMELMGKPVSVTLAPEQVRGLASG